MRSRRMVRGSALLATGAVLALAAGPALAAGTVAQATASAVVVTIGGMAQDSGTYRVTNDGKRETSSGANRPAISVLAGQPFLNTGTLAQDARTEIRGDNGFSFACAGLAGDGATVASAGDGGSCLKPGQNLQLNAANLDLSNLQIVKSDALMGADQQLQDALAPITDQAVPPLQDVLQQVLDQLGDPGVFLNVGAIQSSCMASPTQATGDADLADVAAYATVMDQRVDLVSFPAHPKPNTKIVTNLDEVAKVIEKALREQFTTALDGALEPLNGAADQVEMMVLNDALDQISSQLGPLEDNILDGTLNKQTRTGRNQISVTALDVAVLPAAKEMVGGDALRLEVGKSTCGPNGRVAAPAVVAPDPTPTPKPTPVVKPAKVPTAVPAGLADASRPDDGFSLFATASLGGLLLLAAGAGVATYRRSLR